MPTASARGVLAWKLDDGTLHRFRAHTVILATGGYGARLLLLHVRAHLHRRRQTRSVLRAGLPLQDMEFVQFHPTGMLYGAGCLISEGVRGEGGYLTNSEGERFMERLRAQRQGFSRRATVVSRSITLELRGRAAASGNTRITCICTWNTSTRTSSRNGCRESRILARIFGGVDRHPRTDSRAPDLPLQHGRDPRAPHRRDRDGERGRPGRRRPGIDERRRSSVASRSTAPTDSDRTRWLDLVIFGRACANRIAATQQPHAPGRAPLQEAEDAILARFDAFRHAEGGTPTAELRPADAARHAGPLRRVSGPATASRRESTRSPRHGDSWGMSGSPTAR